ncbi:MAG: hypothetical protein COX62_00405 [Deltaproteobacteria bacterium CG_4_10_14_0_2_um_filter_43_8]|nr:MAG: hypothetical protein COV43_09670 [Deltaproteobacteria bacterium CG11_big_fil_rev_8_21_14_0_20_42_23]PJA22240.1 MAG: hypothetical protein COX62_00405 [Deltaproteobacteria bacterium CG_4_10_14_0_2_um_filter_43_8]PJC64313.1 MAG: hypothetical protein CO021_04735 [Deltaproteobacteria bacterium CG_4_9_14_0_2_um_filter_42_21]
MPPRISDTIGVESSGSLSSPIGTIVTPDGDAGKSLKLAISAAESIWERFSLGVNYTNETLHLKNHTDVAAQTTPVDYSGFSLSVGKREISTLSQGPLRGSFFSGQQTNIGYADACISDTSFTFEGESITADASACEKLLRESSTSSLGYRYFFDGGLNLSAQLGFEIGVVKNPDNEKVGGNSIFAAITAGVAVGYNWGEATKSNKHFVGPLEMSYDILTFLLNVSLQDSINKVLTQQNEFAAPVAEGGASNENSPQDDVPLFLGVLSYAYVPASNTAQFINAEGNIRFVYPALDLAAAAYFAATADGSVSSKSIALGHAVDAAGKLVYTVLRLDTAAERKQQEADELDNAFVNAALIRFAMRSGLFALGVATDSQTLRTLPISVAKQADPREENSHFQLGYRFTSEGANLAYIGTRSPLGKKLYMEARLASPLLTPGNLESRVSEDEPLENAKTPTAVETELGFRHSVGENADLSAGALIGNIFGDKNNSALAGVSAGLELYSRDFPIGLVLRAACNMDFPSNDTNCNLNTGISFR